MLKNSMFSMSKIFLNFLYTEKTLKIQENESLIGL